MSERITLFTDVILPLAVPRLYTYRVPYELNEVVAPGQRVVVQFGKNKLYTALVRKVHQTVPREYEAKYLEGILDTQAIVNETQFKLWEWIADYYCCNIGDVMNAALPSSLKLASETKILLSENFSSVSMELNDKENILIDALESRKELSIKECSDILGIVNVQPYIKSLLEKKIIFVEEELQFKYKPKTETYISLNTDYLSEEKFGELLNKLEKKAPAQVDLLMLIWQLINKKQVLEISKKDLTQQIKNIDNTLKTLEKKEIVSLQQKRIDRLNSYNKELIEPAELNEEQKSAYLKILQSFNNNKPCLLHGVTGSGKTEVYIKLIEAVLNNNKQVLYLLPEIALTTQIINRLQKHFGNDVGVYHSRFNEQERAEIWAKTLRKEHNYKIILGARSALFLPFHNLGLIIVDEEHESTYKQQDPAPRYHARDCAIVLAAMHKANVLLGSATPSYESYYNALNNKYELAEIIKRYLGTLMPEIICIDISKLKTGEKIFSDELLSEIKFALQKNEQVILFQNRRGYTPLWMCETCGWISKCTQCDVSLTYHKNTGQLHCHYCGSSYQPPNKCKACGSHKIKMIGFGTEKIEEELAILLPEAKCSRLDLDSTRNKNAYYNILNDFENKEIDILVGTQMVTKGLDFSNVSLVAILNADSLLSYPDFRSYERAYQLCAQVAGRAGRKDKQGKVIIQSRNPSHWVLQKVVANDYKGMYEAEITERRNFNYPPFYKLIHISLKHKERNKVIEAAHVFADNLKPIIGKRLLGPEKPPVEKIRNEYLRTFMVKTEKSLNYKPIKEQIVNALNNLQQNKDFKQLKFIIDVDCN